MRAVAGLLAAGLFAAACGQQMPSLSAGACGATFDLGRAVTAAGLAVSQDDTAGFDAAMERAVAAAQVIAAEAGEEGRVAADRLAVLAEQFAAGEGAPEFSEVRAAAGVVADSAVGLCR